MNVKWEHEVPLRKCERPSSSEASFSLLSPVLSNQVKPTKEGYNFFCLELKRAVNRLYACT